MLNKTVLKKELSKFMDEESTEFEGYPGSVSESAAMFASAIDKYAGGVFPDSLTSMPSKALFQSTFLGMNSESSNGIAVLVSCFSSYASSLASGMLPKFSGIPPVVTIPIQSVMAIGLGGGKSSECVDALCDIIDTWFRSGTAVQTQTGVVVPWT